MKPTGLIINTELKTSRIRYEHIEEKCVKLVLLYDEAEKAHGMGMQVNVWTVNEEEDMYKCLRAGADMLIGDYPDRMLRVRAAMQAQE